MQTGGTNSFEDELWQQANRNLADHRYNQALYDFQTYIEQYPTAERAVDAKYRTAYIRVVLGEYETAFNDFIVFIDDNPKSRWSFSAEVWRDVLDKVVNSPEKVKTEKIYIEKDDSELDDILKACREENNELRIRIDKLEHIIEGEP